jgi:hypothetical protein
MNREMLGELADVDGVVTGVERSCSADYTLARSGPRPPIHHIKSRPESIIK